MNLNICGSYLVYNIYPKWIEQINIENHIKIFYEYALSVNPNSIKYLEINLDKINWSGLSKNENAMKLIKREIINTDSKIIWSELNINYEILLYLKKNKIYLESLYLNNHKVMKIIDLLVDIDVKNFNKIKWKDFNNNIDNILESDIDWYKLSQNENAILILKKNKDKIKWKYLSLNKNPEAIKLIRERLILNKNIFEFDWIAIADLKNYDAIELIKENINNITICCKEKGNFLYFIDNFYRNPFIFDINYEFLKNRINIILEELMIFMFNPININKFKDWGFDEI